MFLGEFWQSLIWIWCNMLDQVVWGNSVQNWLISAGVIVASLIIGRVISALMSRLAKRTRWEIAGIIADDIGGPVVAFAFVFGMRLSIVTLIMQENVRELLTKGTTFGAGLVITWLFVKAYEAVHKGIFVPYANRPDTRIDLHVFVVLRTIVNIVIWAIGLASSFNSVGVEVTAVLAGLGIGGVALALASQDTVANFFGGLIVLTQRPFKIGDRIEVSGVDGWVHALGFRTTIVKNWYGREVSIPNNLFTNNIVTNIDTQGQYYLEARPRLDPRTSADQLEQALTVFREAIASIDILQDASWEAVDSIGLGYIELELWYAVDKWTSDDADTYANEYVKISAGKTALNLALLRGFEAAGLKFAMPMAAHWNVEVERGAGPKALQPPAPLRPLG